MNITGEELYNLFERKFLELQNFVCDPWDELSDEDQNIWNAVALELAA